MRIRLLIPECQNWDRDQDGENTYICADSHRNIDGRIEMLQHSMVFNNETELVVTSHNFFSFPIDKSIRHNYYEDRDCFLENFITPKIVDFLNKKIKRKKPIIIGFDLLTSTKAKKGSVKSKKKKGSKKSINQGYNPNPYGGIPAVVLYLKVKNKRYQYGTHIWECWRPQRRNDCVECFRMQEENRYFIFRNHHIGLLSCGDIYKYCNKRNSTSYLRNVDIYFDLAHSPLPGERTMNSVNANIMCFTDYLFVTHQVRRNSIRRYCRQHRYPWIFPQSTQYEVGILETSAGTAGIIDVETP